MIGNVMRGLACTTVSLGAMLATAGCTSLRPENETYALLTGGDGGTAGLGGRWACLGKEPPPPPTAIPAVNYTSDVVDWVQNGPPAGLIVCICSGVDIPVGADGLTKSCNTPLMVPQGADAHVLSAPEAHALSLDGFEGCFVPPAKANVSINLPGRDGIFVAMMTPKTVPDALYFNRPPVADLIGKPPVRLITFSTAQNIAQSFRLELDPTLGLVVMRVFDCNGDPASGVYFTLEPSTGLIPFTYRNSLPTPLETTTDDTGQFGFANATPGGSTAHAFLPNETPTLTDDIEIGSVFFNVRAGWATLVDLRP